MEKKTNILCAYCGGHEAIIGHSQFEGCVYIQLENGESSAHLVQHQICKDCKTIIRSNILKKLFCKCPLCQAED